MKVNFNNTFCHWCDTFVYKGNGVYHHFNGGMTLCKSCNSLRDEKMRKRKYPDNQLSLFE
jgi:RNase P subunit RPR2